MNDPGENWLVIFVGVLAFYALAIFFAEGILWAAAEAVP